MDSNKTATEKLYDLWHVMKAEGNCTDYVDEMMTQLELLGTETNTLTKTMIRDKMVGVLNKINETLYA